MAKLKISESQYNTILLREQESRLKDFRATLIENQGLDKELLEEGWKEVVLGVAMMLGVGLTGQNKIQAQDAVKNATTMAQIKATLEDENKLGELVDALKTKGMKDPETKLADNAKKVMDTYNKISDDEGLKYKVDVKTVHSLQNLKGALGQGYALKGGEMTTDTIVTNNNKLVTVKDTIDINFGSDNFFVTGGFELSQGGVDSIQTAIDEIKKQGGKIISVYVESSTDAERINKFKSENDPTGNIQLANLRTKSVIEFVKPIVDGGSITHREIPNNGANVVSTKEFLNNSTNSEVVNALREKTKDFRYVKLSIVAIFEKQAEDTTSTSEFITKYRYDLVKVIANTGQAKKISSHAHFKQKQFTCKKINIKGQVKQACETFK